MNKPTSYTLTFKHLQKITYSVFCVIFISFSFVSRAATYNSLDEKSGLWLNNALWVGGISPGSNVSNNNSIFIRGTITANNNIAFQNNSILTIEASDTLVVNGDLTLHTESDLIIGNGSVLIVLGRFLSHTKLTVSALGKIVVFGSFTVNSNHNSINLQSSNSLYVFGTTSLSNVTFPASNVIGTQESFLSSEQELITWLDANYETQLPVELSSFCISATPLGLQFNWRTESETNNDYFTIQYSYNGMDFIDLAQIMGNGTTSHATEYSYTDVQENYSYSLVYFRLKQTDFNGDEYFSAVLAISLKQQNQIKVFPNPATDIITISGTQNIHSVKVFNAIQQVQSTLPAQGNTYNISALPQGTYTLLIETNSGTKTTQIIKK